MRGASRVAATLLILAASTGFLGAAEAKAPRVVTLGSSVTEIACELGAGAELAGIDQSSLAYLGQCPQAKHLDYFRQISSEGVLSLAPTLVLTTSEAGPAAALEQIKSSGVKLVVITEKHSWDGTVEKIQTVARELNREKAGTSLIAAMGEKRQKAESIVAAAQKKGLAKPRVLLVMSQAGEGSLMCAGEGSGAQAMIDLAGGTNAVSGFKGYKPLSPEALLAAKPDIVLFPGGSSHGLEGGEAALKENVGLKHSPAVQKGRLIAINLAEVLGFGSSLGKSMESLARQFYPETSLATQ
jgi:iron complex transport system substrate-binding protein